MPSSSSNTRIRVVTAPGMARNPASGNKIVVVCVKCVYSKHARYMAHRFQRLEERHSCKIIFDKIIQRVDDNTNQITEEFCFALTERYMIEEMRKLGYKVTECPIVRPIRGQTWNVFFVKLKQLRDYPHLHAEDIRNDLRFKLDCLVKIGIIPKLRNIDIKIFERKAYFAYIHMDVAMGEYECFLAFTWLSNIYWSLEGVDPLTKINILYSSNVMKERR